MATVRISEDHNDRLKAIAAKREMSVTQLVAEAVDRLLDAPAPVARASGPRDVRPSSATVSRAGQRRRPSKAVASGVAQRPSECLHPVGRQIGGVCMECGRGS